MNVDASEVVIVGCGLVGAPLALALSRQGFSVTTIDRHAAEAPTDDPLDQRCTALSASTVALLENWGLWNSVASVATAIDSVHVSQKGYFGATRLKASEHNVSALGYVVENRRYQRILEEQLQQSSVRRLIPAELEALELGSSSATVTVVSGDAAGRTTHHINAKLVVAVDGVSSTVRELAGISSTHIDYQQSALLTTVQLEQPHRNMAFERFTADGPLALLPSYGKTASVVCCLSPEAAQEMATDTDEQVLRFLQQQFGHRLGAFEQLGKRKIIPLIRIEATQQTSTRLVLMGNAARLLHPVAGQGYNLALRDVADLLECLDATDAGDATNLETFARMRSKDQLQVVQLTDTLARVFRGKSSTLAHLRGLSLLGLDTLGPLRLRFAYRALGHQS